MGEKYILAKNPFEFSRQQEDQSNDPELMLFKSSQRLHNPNATNNKRINLDAPAILQPNYPPKIDGQDYVQQQQQPDLRQIEDFRHSVKGTISNTMDNQKRFLPICPRFASYFDSNDNVIYSSNGNLLEKFEKKDNTLVFLEAFKVLDPGITIDKICKHPKGFIITGDRRIALFCTIEKKVLARGKHFDHIIAVKSLSDAMIVVLTARKKINILKILEDGSFVDAKNFELNDECTIFTGILYGDTVEELEVFAGGILGSIHRHKPFQGADVLSSYKGHEGMIFAMNICGNKLYTIGDDRSLRVYDINSANELHVVYGHESRIRSLTVTSDEKIFSAGDAICVWKWVDSSLKLVEKHEVGIGKIVHLNVIDKLLLASSMNGAMVTVQIKEKQCQQIEIPDLKNLVVRAFIKTLEGTYFFVNEQKHLYFVSTDTVAQKFIENRNIRFDSLRVSKSGKYIAAASDNKVFLIEAATKKYCTISVEDVIGGEVFIGDELFVIAKDGNGVALSMKNNVFIKKQIFFSRGGLVKCGLAVDDLILFGTAKGYFVAFHKNHLSKEAFHFKVSPKNEPVMDITVINSQLYVITRDDNVYQVVDVFTTIEKPTGFLLVGDEYYIWGFRASEFVFCPLRSPHPLAVYECGGGHRICDVFPVFDSKKNFIGIKYEYIVRGEFKIVAIDISHIQQVIGPFHQSNIYGIAMLNEGRSIVTAGIDTEILLCSINDDGRFSPKWRSTAHLSSIHSLDSVKLRNGIEIIATCGGTSEIRLWNVSENSLNPISVWSCKPDFRYVSIKVRQSLEDDNILYIFTACSIREIQIFSYNISTKKIEKLLSYQNPEPSTFSKVAVSSDLLTIYAATTSGTVTALSWAPGSSKTSYIQSIEASDSGLSAICAVNLDDPNLSKNVCAVGDEGGNFALVDFETESIVLKSSHAHYSTLSDGNLKILDTMSFKTNVGDPIAIVPIDNSCNYLVAGQGIDIVKLV
uniref:Uncharacterized protein n=1 Tax=Panagrolaimus sp. ES5 TaxID=591445 RepID=A0AC34FHI2_9BILA